MPGYVCKMKKQRNGAGDKLPFSEGCDRVITTKVYRSCWIFLNVFWLIHKLMILSAYIIEHIQYNTVAYYVYWQKKLFSVINITFLLYVL